MLYTETVSRTFTSGVLAGLTIEQRIPRVSNPRNVGTVQTVAKPLGASPYVDTVINVEPWKGV